MWLVISDDVRHPMIKLRSPHECLWIARHMTVEHSDGQTPLTLFDYLFTRLESYVIQDLHLNIPFLVYHTKCNLMKKTINCINIEVGFDMEVSIGATTSR
jgi:hypothetical protein